MLRSRFHADPECYTHHGGSLEERIRVLIADDEDLFRRGLAAYAWVLLLLPLHWLLLGAAAWRALYQLLADPYRWEKTDHGLARTSRVRRRPAAETVLRKLILAEEGRPPGATGWTQ